MADASGALPWRRGTERCAPTAGRTVGELEYLLVRAFQIKFLGCPCLLLLLVLLLCEPCAGGTQIQPPEELSTKKVLILHAFESQVPVFAQTDSGLSRALLAGGMPLENQFFDFLDLRRNADPEFRKRLVEYLRVKYRHRKFDLIITMFPEALQFVLNEGRTLFSDAPIVALYLPTVEENPRSGRRIFRHSAQLDMRGTLEIALRLVRDVKRVYVVIGAHAIDRQQEELARRAFKKWEERLEFRYLSHLPFEETLTTLANAPRDAVVLFLTYVADVRGTTYTSPDAAKRLSQVSTVPIFGVLQAPLGHGIVGGALLSFEDTGTATGRLVLDLLRGNPISEGISHVLSLPPVPMFDWRELKRWNLSVDLVPPESRIINREYTLWEQYRTEVIAALFAFVLQALLIVSLIISRVQRQQADRKLADQLRFDKLLAELSARFVNVRADRIEEEIQTAQRRICETLDLDRSTLWQLSEGELRLTHIHMPSGTPPISEWMIANVSFPWLYQQVMKGEVVAFSKLADLPPEAARDRESLQKAGTTADLIIPLVEEGTMVGALAFAVTRGEREWPEHVVSGARIVAEVIANALARRRASQALRESQERLALAATSADVRLWEVEAETERVWIMERGREFFGLAPDETPTLDRISEFIHPDDREAWRHSLLQAFETGEALRAEFRVVRPDGSVRWFVAQGGLQAGVAGKPNRLLGVTIDVTHRRQIEERLRTSEALSTGVLTSLPGQMVIVDPAGAILRASDTWPKFAAGDGTLDPTVLAVGVGQPHARPRPAEKANPVIKEIQGGIDAVLRGTQANFCLEYAYSTRTEERWASVSVLPLQRPERGAVIYRQDITAQQRSRLEAERLRRDLTHVGRVTTMGEMAAALAHELNQPLTAILSNAHAGERYLAQTDPPLDEIREILQDVVGDARRAGDVIQRLRSLLRKEEARFVPLDVNQVVRDIAGLVHTDAVLRKVAIDLELAPDLPAIRGDRIQLQQVLLNLILNGMEAMGPHGGGKRIVIRTQLADAAVCVAVRDEGPGIPAGELSRVFETFYTTKASGMGMGLPISRSIIEAHGGRIWTENNPDRGATFSFTIPTCPAEPTSG